MADQCPNKSDIQSIFKRLRNIPANKVCFDCNAKNPTWATVTYGVFICIDCSAVHRGLGVHLTFVRSTQLDTNWTWIQLRQMQLGGNANANAFFRQHNCSTTDAQQKYNSRAAQLYREKLHQMAIQAMRVHGSKFDVAASRSQVSASLVHLDSTHDHSAVEEKKEVDFFEEIKNSESSSFGFDEPLVDIAKVPKTIQPTQMANKKSDLLGDTGEPNVNFTADSSSTAVRKSTIGARKPAPKKGLGAKKGGLGAQRVKANFEDIEREAQIADELKVRADEDAKKAAEIKVEEEETQLASMRLAYKDLSMKQKREEDIMKQSDPKKAQQMERLGMGFASRTGVSHSALTDMKCIEQEGVVEGGNRSSLASTNTRSTFDTDFFDDFQFSSGGYSMYKGSQSDAKSMDWMIVESSKERGSSGNSSSSGSNKGWTDQEPRRSSASSASSPDSHRPREPAPPAADGTEAQKKFGSAKAISSDQFFQDSRDNDWERKSNLSRFEGSSSISSSDYFNDGRSSMGSRSNQPSVQAPDLEDVKESVRQGVTKVAGKLSNLANGVMSSIQERYGY